MTHGAVAAVVVDYDAGQVLADCVRSLRQEGVDELVVVENGDPVAAESVLGEAGAAGPEVALLASGRNLGYGAGANRGVAASGDSEYVLVCNPDLQVHPGAVGALREALDEHPAWALAGPRILTPAGDVYPSVRRFPSPLDAAGHAVLGTVWPGNPFTARYRSPGVPGTGPSEADWVSGACFLARRSAFEALGGFDEAYFMFAEDMDLCWRARRRGWAVGFQPGATVTHVEGVSRSHHPYRMALSHHRSALRFAARTSSGWRRLLLPLAAALLGARLVAACTRQTLRRSRLALGR